MDAALLRVTTPDLPAQGVRSGDFAGWSGVDVYRPLLAVRGTTSTYRAWTVVPAASSDRVATFPLFAKSVPRIPPCKTDENNKPIGKPLKTKISHAQIFRVLQSATSDGRLVGMRVRRELVADCDGIGEVASDHWFLLSKERPPRELKYLVDKSGWSASLVPIEVGDFDGDGSEEALFWYSGYNEDGYVLFFDGFSKSARFTWGYH